MKSIQNKVIIYFFVSIVLGIGIGGCIPEEDPVKPHERGDVIEATVELGNLYQNQIYFNLATESIVASNKTTDWDIAFCSYPDSFPIILNGAKSMRVLNTGKLKFNEVSISDTAGVDENQWGHDNPFGKLDSTGFGTWWESIKIGEVISKSEVYILDRGVNERGKPVGFKKIQILGFEEDTYFIKYSNLDGTSERELSIKKNPLKNFIQISFNGDGSVVDLEPPADNWDLCFTKYTEKLYTSEGDFLWYGVTGPLTNPKNVSVVSFKDTLFDNVTYSGINELNFSPYINSIGHEWKWFDLGKGFYEVFPKMVFIIKTPNGFYKFHFVDFYNPSGEKGYPKFEYQKL